MSSALQCLVRPVATPSIAPLLDGAAAALVDADSRRHAHLVVRVASEYFALPLEGVTEALDAPELLTVAGVAGQWPVFVLWRGRRLPLADSRAAFGIAADEPCAVALILAPIFADSEQPMALAVDELCEVRALPPSALRAFVGRYDPHGVVRAVAVDNGVLIAVVSPAALAAATLTEAARPLVDPEADPLADAPPRTA